jgi:hypothetical protein
MWRTLRCVRHMETSSLPQKRISNQNNWVVSVAIVEPMPK